MLNKSSFQKFIAFKKHNKYYFEHLRDFKNLMKTFTKFEKN